MGTDRSGGAPRSEQGPSRSGRTRGGWIWWLLGGAACVAVVLVFTDASGAAAIAAVVLGLVILRVGLFFLQQFATPPPPPPEPGMLRKVKLTYRCETCGAEVRMTSAASQDPEPPRHCMDEMELVASEE